MKSVLLLAAVSAIGLLQAPLSRGATASVLPPNDFGQLTLRYVADPGEANDVSIGFAPGNVLAGRREGQWRNDQRRGGLHVTQRHTAFAAMFRAET